MEKWMWIGVAAGVCYAVGFILLLLVRWIGPDRLGWIRGLIFITGMVLLAIYLEDLLGINMWIIGIPLVGLGGVIMGPMTQAMERAYDRKHKKEV